MMADLLARLQPILSRRQEDFVLVSMAAGLTLQRLRGDGGPLLPHPADHAQHCLRRGSGPDAVRPLPEVTEEQLSAFLTLLSASGRLEPLEEHLIDAGSAVAGCGGAFVSLFLRRWPTARHLRPAPVTRHGATPPRWCWVRRSWLSSPTSTAAMKDAVCSPGGTTIAGSGRWSGAASARRPWRPSLPPMKRRWH